MHNALGQAYGAGAGGEIRGQLGHGVPALSHCRGTHSTLVAAAGGVLEFYLENFVLELLWVMNPG